MFRYPTWLLLLVCWLLAAQSNAAPPLKPGETAKGGMSAWKPQKPVTLIVPYAPGGGTDATARAVAKQLTLLWRQPVIVENQPGADGLIGTRRVMDAKPDGYTLLMQVPSIVLTKYQPALKGIDPLTRLAPVSIIGQSPQVVVVNGKVPVQSLSELVAYCKLPSQACSAGSGEIVARLMVRKFASDAGLPNVAVANYRGTSPIVSDLVSGNLTFAFSGVAATTPMHRMGILKIIAANAPSRSRQLPDVPTSTEAGFSDLVSVSWFGMFAPRETPPAVIDAIYFALKEAVKDPDVQRAIALSGADLVVNTPAEFSEQIRQDDARYGALSKRFPIE